MNEIVSLRRLTNLNSKVVRLLNARENAIYSKKNNRGTYRATYICTEYAKFGNMFDFLHRVGHLPENLARVYFTDLVHALELAQDAGIVHHDVRLENLLLDANFRLLLADFGMA